MSEPIQIEVFRNMNAGDFSSALSNSESKLLPGSAAAECAAFASSVANRAAMLISADNDCEQLQYIIRNTEILRNYMVHLIDEDVKCRGPMRRALKEGGEDEIEAARHPACAICGEVINMMVQLLDFLKLLKPLAQVDSLVLIKQSAHFAYCAMCVCRDYILDVVSKSDDETYVFVTRRENEITFENCEKAYRDIIS